MTSPPGRRPWVIPVIVGGLIGLIVVTGVVVGLKLAADDDWASAVDTATSSTTTSSTPSTVTVTETAPATTDSPDPDSTDPDSTDPDSTSPDTTDPDSTSPDTTDPDTTDPDSTSLPVPPVADAAWYAQFGAFDDYARAEVVRDEHYGSLILPGEMVGSSARYVVARPTDSRHAAQQVCAQFADGGCIVKHRS